MLEPLFREQHVFIIQRGKGVKLPCALFRKGGEMAQEVRVLVALAEDPGWFQAPT